jgi:hypothetical protein
MKIESGMFARATGAGRGKKRKAVLSEFWAHLEKVINNAIIHTYKQSRGEQKEKRLPDKYGFRVSARNDTPLPRCFKTGHPTLCLHDYFYRGRWMSFRAEPRNPDGQDVCARVFSMFYSISPRHQKAVNGYGNCLCIPHS